MFAEFEFSAVQVDVAVAAIFLGLIRGLVDGADGQLYGWKPLLNFTLFSHSWASRNLLIKIQLLDCLQSSPNSMDS